jgi:hypothetical protein
MEIFSWILRFGRRVFLEFEFGFELDGGFGKCLTALLNAPKHVSLPNNKPINYKKSKKNKIKNERLSIKVLLFFLSGLSFHLHF